MTGRAPPGFPSAASPPWKAAVPSRHSGAQLSHEPLSAPHSEPAEIVLLLGLLVVLSETQQPTPLCGV